MNRATKLALINLSNNSHFNLKTALFHSTPVLNRRGRAPWEYAGRSYKSSSRRSNFNSRRLRKFYVKEDSSDFAKNLFQEWDDFNEFRPSSSHKSSRFRNLNGGPQSFNGTRANRMGAHKKGFQFCDDSEDDETILRSAFGSKARLYFHSFINDESPSRASHFYNSNWGSRNWRQRFEDSDEDEYDDDDNDDDDYYDDDDDDRLGRVKNDLRKDRLALGLSGSGPLNLKDVKNAYRACALKWHPDRHNGSSKAVAEEKFKVCSAAYQSLCDKLAPN